MYNVFAVLSLDLFLAIMWLAAMGTNAAHRAAFTVPVELAGCYDDGSMVDSTVCWKLRKRSLVAGEVGMAVMVVVCVVCALELYVPPLSPHLTTSPFYVLSYIPVFEVKLIVKRPLRHNLRQDPRRLPPRPQSRRPRLRPREAASSPAVPGARPSAGHRRDVSLARVPAGTARGELHADAASAAAISAAAVPATPVSAAGVRGAGGAGEARAGVVWGGERVALCVASGGVWTGAAVRMSSTACSGV